MTWWQWTIGLVEFCAAFRAVDWFLHARAQPEAMERRRVRFERDQYAVANLVLNDQYRLASRSMPPSCRHCGRVAFSIYPNGVGPLCRQCLVERRTAAPSIDFSRYEPPGW